MDAVDQGNNGCLVKTVTESGAIAKDGRIAVGDYLVSVNNESMRRITSAQSRAILRRANLLSTDIRYVYTDITCVTLLLHSHIKHQELGKTYQCTQSQDKPSCTVRSGSHSKGI